MHCQSAHQVVPEFRAVQVESVALLPSFHSEDVWGAARLRAAAARIHFLVPCLPYEEDNPVKCYELHSKESKNLHGAAPGPEALCWLVQVESVALLPSFYSEDTPASANETWARLHSDPLFAVSQA